MTLRHGLFVTGATAGVTGAQDARLALAALLNGSAGVLFGGAVAGSSSGPNMQYTIAAGGFATARGTAASDGLYVFGNDGSITVSSAAPAPLSGSRWDLIWVRHKNVNGGFADDLSDPAAGVTVGTSGSSPSKPYSSVPAGALVLAEASVGAGIANATSATITQVAAASVARGAILPCTDSSQYPASPRVGVYVDDAALGLLRWDGSGWSEPGRAVAKRTRNTTFNNTGGASAIGTWPTDAGSVGDIVYSSGIFTVTRAGFYAWRCTVNFGLASSSIRASVYVQVNGAQVSDGQQDNYLSSALTTTITGGALLKLNAGDTVQPTVFVTGSGTTVISPLSFSLAKHAA